MKKTAAVMSGNTVENIIVIGDDIEQAEKELNLNLIEYTEENPAGIGWTYDEATGKFNPPTNEV